MNLDLQSHEAMGRFLSFVDDVAAPKELHSSDLSQKAEEPGNMAREQSTFSGGKLARYYHHLLL
jgi:hypothetical protein